MNAAPPIRKTPTRPPAPSFSLARPGLLQRKCACGGTPGLSGECEECREKRETEMLQRKIAQPSTLNHQHSEVPPIVHDVLRSPGHPLDEATRAFMEPRFGHDFSRVRVHTDVPAARAARAVTALAFTVGSNIVFGPDQYAPRTKEGQRLLAHELTHVVQQTAGGRNRGTVSRVPEPDNALQNTSDTTLKLRVLADDLDRLGSYASEKLESATGEMGAELSMDPGDTARDTEPLLGVLAEGSQRIREAASSQDEAFKLSVLAAFNWENLLGAENNFEALPRDWVSNARPPSNEAAEPVGQLATMPMRVSTPSEPSEIEADRAAAQVLSGNSVSVMELGEQRLVQRQIGEALTAAGTAILVTDAELSPVEAGTGPPGWAVAAGLAVAGVSLLALGYVLTRTKPCPPCPPNPAPQIDRVPPSTPHFPCPGDHWHYQVYNQNPQTCQCFLSGRLFGGCCGQPPLHGDPRAPAAPC
jgi:Domain of unknown function (DUF4157)